MRMRYLMAATALVGTLSTAALAENPGLYISGGLGLNQTRDTDVEGSGLNNDASWEKGWAGIAAIGWALNNGLRFEFEFNYRENDLDFVRGAPGLSTGGDVTSYGGMVNALYDIDTGTNWMPYVGVGIGAANVDFDVRIGSVTANDDSWEFAYQGIVGVAYALTDHLRLVADYRYFATLDPSVKVSTGGEADVDYHNHTFMIGVRYAFGPPPAKPMPAAAPPPPPPPPPPAAQPPITRSFLVFFDFDRADITPEANRVISQAYDNYRRANVTRINLTGHADRSGPARYNQGLSLRRANAVKAAMMRLGVPESQIAVMARGETQPLVPTPDGVREPQNRRVEIVF